MFFLLLSLQAIERSAFLTGGQRGPNLPNHSPLAISALNQIVGFVGIEENVLQSTVAEMHVFLAIVIRWGHR